jgi:hypothetical protein
MDKKADEYNPREDPRVKYSDDGRSATVELDQAVPTGKDGKGEPVMEVTVRKPSIGDMEAGDKSDGNVGSSVLIMASVTGLPAATIRKMDFDDFQRLSNVVESFGGGKGQRTGGTS